MDDILISSGVRSSLLSLQSIQNSIEVSQTRLSTGKKVNSVIDNPANYFMASSLRTSSAALFGLLDNISNGQRLIDAASNGMSSMKTTISSAIAALQAGLSSQATTAVTTGSVSNLSSTSSFATTAGRTLTVSDGTTTATYTTVGTTTTVAQLQNAINAVGTIKADISGSGQFQLQAQGATAITIGGTLTAPELAQFGLVAGVTAAGTLNSARTAAASQFNSLRAQIDQLASDSGYNGVSLLNGGGSKVTFNEKGTSSLNLVGTNNTSTGLGIGAAAGGLQTNADINASIASATAALAMLKDQGALLSTNSSVLQARMEFTKAQINTLNLGADFLVQADTNQESANLLASQTRQQMASTALSLAVQADRSVLRLFGG